jgi:SAM-dependent methyltransferase
LHGSGIEIGALHQPLTLDGLPISQIRYVDRIGVSELRRHYTELSWFKFAPVHVLDDGETLATFADNSLDFIVANHFIEHTRNPLGALRNWLRKLRPGGIIYMAIPDMRRIFDAGRPLTPLEHLAEDDAQSSSEPKKRDYEHYLEYARFVDKQTGAATEPHAQQLIAANFSIHFHTFVATTFIEMLRYAQEQLALPFEILAYADTLPGSDEFLVVLRKRTES